MKEFKNADATVIGEIIEENGQFVKVRSIEGLSYTLAKQGLSVNELPQAENVEDAVSELSEPVKPVKKARKSKKAVNAAAE